MGTSSVLLVPSLMKPMPLVSNPTWAPVVIPDG
jgi:hypothetical protein